MATTFYAVYEQDRKVECKNELRNLRFLLGTPSFFVKSELRHSETPLVHYSGTRDCYIHSIIDLNGKPATIEAGDYAITELGVDYKRAFTTRRPVTILHKVTGSSRVVQTETREWDPKVFLSATLIDLILQLRDASGAFKCFDLIIENTKLKSEQSKLESLLNTISDYIEAYKKD